MINRPFCATSFLMRKKNRFAAPQPLGEILSSAFKKRGMAIRLEENTLFKLWPQAVGQQIALQTQPDRIHAGTLFVRTTSSVWVQQLHFMKEDILQKINQLAGKKTVRDIHFTVGFSPSRTRAKTEETVGKKINLKARDRKMIDESTEKLSDPELAAIVKRTMEKEISRRRNLEAKTDR